MNDIKKKAIKSVFWVGSAKLYIQFVSWIATLILVRVLEPKDFGMFAIASAFVLILLNMYDLGVGAAIIQKEKINDYDLSTYFWLCFISSILLYVFTWAVSPYIADFFRQKDLSVIIRILAVVLIFHAFMDVPFVVLTKQLDFDKRAKAEIISGSLSSVIAVTAAFLNLNIWAILLRFIIKHLLLSIMICYYYPWKPKFVFNLNGLITYLKFGVSLVCFRFIKDSYLKIDKFIIGKFLSKTLLGYYSVAVELSRMPIDKFVTMINQVSFPVFSTMQNDKGQLKSYYLKITNLVTFFVFPMLLGAMSISHNLILIVLGDKWQPIIPLFQLLCFVALFQTLFGITLSLNNALGRPKVNFYFALIFSFVLLIFVCFGVMKFGILGAALAWCFAYPILFIIFLIYSTKIIDITIFELINAIKNPVIGSLIMYSMVKLINGFFLNFEISIGNTIILITSGVMIYLLFIFIFSFKSINDIKEILQIARQKI